MCMRTGEKRTNQFEEHLCYITVILFIEMFLRRLAKQMPQKLGAL